MQHAPPLAEVLTPEVIQSLALPSNTPYCTAIYERRAGSGGHSRSARRMIRPTAQLRPARTALAGRLFALEESHRFAYQVERYRLIQRELDGALDALVPRDALLVRFVARW